VAWRRTTQTIVLNTPLGAGQCSEVQFNPTVGTGTFRTDPGTTEYGFLAADNVVTAVSNSKITDTVASDNSSTASSGHVVWPAP
jgi:hypothetical protein